MSYTVYKHTSPNGKVYIGITGQRPSKRWERGKGYKHSAHFAAAIKKYGWDNIQHDILLTGLTQDEAERAEVALINSHKATDPRFGYNIAPGGSTSKMSERGRAKLSELMRGDANPTRRFGHPFAGKHHSEESRRKMSDAARARTGRTVTEETRQKLREVQAKTPVVCLDTGTTYPSIHAAAEATGASATKICAVCKGRRKSTSDLRLAYVKGDKHGNS